MADISRARRALYVGGLDERVNLETLKAAFLPFGELTDVQLPLDVKTQQNKGFAFVEFAEEGDAADAVANMDKSELFGRVLRVNIAKVRAGGGAGGKGGAVWADADEWYRSLRESGEDVGEGEEGGALKEGGSSTSLGGAGGAGAGGGAGEQRR